MLIDVSMMRGEIPRFKAHLLPNEAATYALDCEFTHGVLTPMKQNAMADNLPLSPRSLFRYGDHWLVWSGSAEVSAISSPQARDPYQRVYFTGEGKPKVTAQDIAIGPNGVGPQAAYDLGVPKPSSAPLIVAIDASTGESPPEGEAAAFDDETRFYVQTYVTRFGEEGIPSNPSQELLVERPGSTVTVRITSPTTNTHNITHIRLYRTSTSLTDEAYLLVDEVPISQSTIVDAARDATGPVVETWDYALPPENLQGLCQMANGICAGFSGNEILFSDAYLPYAWPKRNRATTEHEIVAITAIGTSLVVGTKGYPYLFSGITPDAMTATKIEREQACVSARSMVVINGVVFYASPDGIVAIGSDGAIPATESIIDPVTWRARWTPESLSAVSVEGLYVAQSEGGSFVFDPVSMAFTRTTDTWDASFTDLENDRLVMVNGRQLLHWRQGEQHRPLVWRSKAFLVPKDALLSSARIQTDHPERLSLRFLADGEEVFTVAMGSLTHDAFRLPCVRATYWQVEVSGTADVDRILLASSMQELA
ncbi:hypothetical protein A1OO_08560 [Enterovibrio norvegicus FF-33]|uniref:hypothetical protein n=1 Tax=Enterovibrio norvegicus TaxID=188144 RepID=UPI0002F1D537|nr:hypothetical protein [Enterovibrio norvegicus]OEE65850.1 hypothetical protein A1OO_08560 [Enterovibrio norvegicus FF-33]